MRKEELIKELLMGYEELADYLKEKYGPAKYDYFCNESKQNQNEKNGMDRMHYLDVHLSSTGPGNRYTLLSKANRQSDIQSHPRKIV